MGRKILIDLTARADDDEDEIMVKIVGAVDSMTIIMPETEAEPVEEAHASEEVQIVSDSALKDSTSKALDESNAVADLAEATFPKEPEKKEKTISEETKKGFASELGKNAAKGIVVAIKATLEKLPDLF